MGPKILSATTFVFAIVIALAAVLQTAEAETHKVSWSNTLGADYYTSWAANHTFKVGDVLVFDFTTGRHDVAELTKDAYEKCNVTGFIGTPKSEGPANYTLSATGDHYFICLFPEHCDQGGQKLTISVAAGDSGSAPTPAPAPSSTSTPPSKSESPPPSGDESPPPTTPPPPPSTPSTTAPPPEGSTGSSSYVITIPTVFMSIAIALFCLF